MRDKTLKFDRGEGQREGWRKEKREGPLHIGPQKERRIISLGEARRVSPEGDRPPAGRLKLNRQKKRRTPPIVEKAPFLGERKSVRKRNLGQTRREIGDC